MSINIDYVPTLTPTAKEFSNVNEYLEKVEKQYAHKYGTVKIKPPKTWKAKKGGYQQDIETGMIPKPIEQNAYGKGGIYECLFIVQKSLSMKDYIKRGAKFENITEGKEPEQIEKMFYKHIAFSPPLYGADSRNSLFDPGCSWNLGEMKTLLQDGLKDYIEGVNDPYLYVGNWKTTFSWHKEDLNLGAINYLHYGKPKFWYSIPHEDHHYLEKMAKINFADSFNKCPEYLRHKTTIINPQLLKQKFPECRINKCIQREGEFVVVFPGAYHHGFNFGFNIAEAVNYATKNWLNIYLEANVCRCTPDQVKINHKQFYDNMIASRPELKNDPCVKQFFKKIKDLGLYNENTQSAANAIQQQNEKQQQQSQQQQKPSGRGRKPAQKQQKINNDNTMEVEDSSVKQQQQKQQREKRQAGRSKAKQSNKQIVDNEIPIQSKKIQKVQKRGQKKGSNSNKNNEESEGEDEQSLNSNSSSTAHSRDAPIQRGIGQKKSLQQTKQKTGFNVMNVRNGEKQMKL